MTIRLSSLQTKNEDLLTLFSTNDGEEHVRTCAKHFLKTWFADNHAGRQIAGLGLETLLSLDLLHNRRRDGGQRRGGTEIEMEKKRWFCFAYARTLKLIPYKIKLEER